MKILISIFISFLLSATVFGQKSISDQLSEMEGGRRILEYFKAFNSNDDQKLKQFFFNLFVQMMRSSYARSIKDIKAIANEIATVGRERQKNFLVYCQRMIREYFVSNLKHSEMIYLNQEENRFGNRFAPFINEKNIIDFTAELALAERHIEQNVNAKMVFFDLCLKITMLLKR